MTTHGGKRTGAGRKPANTKQITLRVPVWVFEAAEKEGISIQEFILNNLKNKFDNQNRRE